MKTEKVMSVYDLQDEGKLGAVLNSIEGVDFERISTEACDGEEIAKYHVSMEETLIGGQLLGSIVQFVQENEGIQIKFCSVDHTGQ